MTSIKLDNPEEAADTYSKILSVDKNNIQISLKLADIYKTLHRYQDELDIYNQLLQGEPLNIDLLNKKGTALVNLERYENAVDTFNKILSTDLQNEDALLCKQDALTKRDKKRKEQEEEQTSSEYKTARTYDLNNEGFDLLDKKEYDAALVCFEKSLNIESDNSDALLGKGIAKLALQDNDTALQCFDIVLAKDSQNVKALINKGEALNNLNLYDEALVCFDSALKIEPNNFGAICDKEKTLVIIKNNEAAAQADKPAEAAVAVDENIEDTSSADPINEEIEPLSEDNQTEEASKTDSTLAEAIKAVEDGNYEKAIAAFDQITDDTLLDEDTLYAKAVAYHHLKKYDETINCCNLILEKQPNHISALALKEDSQAQKDKHHIQEEIDKSKAVVAETNETEKILPQDDSTNIQASKTNELDTLLLKGYTLFEEGEYDQAMHYFNRAEEIDPHNVRVLTFKGTTYHLQDKIEDAIACYNQVLEQEPHNVKVLSNKGSALEELAQYNEAIECYKKALETEPQNANTLYLLGMAYKAISEYTTAVDYFTQVLNIDADHAEAIEQKEATEEFLDRMIQDKPQEEEKVENETHLSEEKNIDASQDAPQPIENKEEQTAIKADEVTAPTPSPEEIEAEAKAKEWYNLDQKFKQLYDNNYFDEALEVLDQMLEIDPSNIDLIYNKGLILAVIGKHSKAIEYFDKVLATDANDINLLYNKGLSLGKLEKDNEAIEYYDKVLAIDPNDINALNNKGVTLAKKNKDEKALECYNRVLAIYPNRINTLINKGSLLYKTREYNEAIICFDKVLGIEPNNIIALSAKGYSFDSLEKFDKAIDCYDKILAIDPSNINIISEKGLSLSKSKRYDKAIDNYNKVLAIDKANKEVLHNKGIACLYINKSKESAISFNKIGYTALDVLSLFTPLKEKNEEKSLFEVIAELIDLNENDYFNKIVNRDDKQRSVYKEIYILSLKIVKKLHIDDALEQRVAHYTSHSVANLLFGLTHEQDELSPFRLNSVATANDPKEGNTLFDFLKINKDNNHENSDYQAFIGCFSFNTESLNQFRLYSKDNQQEATGVSIVANSNFFSKQIDFNNSLVGSKNRLLNEQEEDKNKRKAESLFRCIYVDPKTNRIISVGQKESYSIYRENDSDKEIDTKIEAYNAKLKNLLMELREQMNTLTDKLTNDKLDVNTVRELLIVLRYLVKHVAFKEEQECRIINIEELTSDKVKINPADQRLYIDYIPMNKESVDIIYSAPLIDQFKIFRDILWKKRNIRTLICDHPFADDKKKIHFD